MSDGSDSRVFAGSQAILLLKASCNVFKVFGTGQDVE